MEIIHKGHDAAVFDAQSDAQSREEGIPERVVRHAVDQFSTDPPLYLGQFFDHFLDRPAPGGFAVKRGYAAKLAIEMTAACRKTALAGHIGIGTQEFHPR